jgi:hypothetical protein
MLVMYVIKPNKGIHVKYSTSSTKDPILSKTMAVIAMMRGKPKDGYHCWCSNKHYKKTVELRKYNTTTG